MTKFSDFIRFPGTAGPPTKEGIRALGFALTADFPIELEGYLWVSGPQSFSPTQTQQGRDNLDLGDVDNTSDADKPISTATQSALDLKAPLTSPALMGNPTAPTQAPGDGSTRIATTAYADANVSSRLALAGGTMAGAINMANNPLNNPAGEFLRGYISPGFNLDNGTDPINDISFPAGVVASDEATPILMTHAAANCELDVAFGTGTGGRFDTSISDGTWHCFIISNGTTVSRGFSKSLNPTGQPNYPSGYTHYRRVGSPAIRVAGNLLGFTQAGDLVLWDNFQDNLNIAAPGTAAVLQALTVPVGILTTVHFNTLVRGGASNADFRFSSPSQSDIAPSGTANFSLYGPASASGILGMGSFSILTNTASQIRYRSNFSDANVFLRLVTTGYTDTRGRT